MVQCFAPDCNHQSERETCKFYRFPKSPSEFERWKKLLRRQDRAPGSNSRVCSCHFHDELKVNGPEIFKRNADKFFPTTEVRKPKIAKKVKPATENPSGLMLVSDIVEQYYASAASTSRENNTETPTQEVLLQIEVENLRKEVKDLKIKGTYQREVYSVLSLKDEGKEQNLYA
ncbi:52 kDa repressor of the inhibitor of the protein kinase-like [Rhopilema esculentum]|uniref:52 kDa repressor of the inhibitor of the protein kinase-like n=1 Tax=Rhopilema esculentum TaxID=499914 RepID=UPI0031DFCC60